MVSIVKQFFHSADETEHKYKLSVLTETGLSLATQEFVDKEEKAALHSIVGHQIKKTVDYTVLVTKSSCCCVILIACIPLECSFGAKFGAFE